MKKPQRWTSVARARCPTRSTSRPAATTSELMCRLVNSRDKVFEMQRACSDSERSKASRAAMDAHLAKLPSTSTCPAAFRNYSAFCTTNSIPVLPIPPPVLALWLYDKCASRDDWPRTYQRQVEQCAAAVNDIWAGNAAYETIRELDPTSRAVCEFMSERKELWNQRNSGKPTRRASSSSASSSSSSSETESAKGTRSRHERPRGTRAGPSGARSSAATSRSQWWIIPTERKVEAQAVESESADGVEAEVFIPTRKRLRRRKGPLAFDGDSAPILSSPEQTEAKRARLDLTTSSIDASPARPALRRHRAVISSPEVSAVESSDGESVARPRSRWAPSPSPAPKVPSRSTSPELRCSASSAPLSLFVDRRRNHQLVRPKVEPEELADGALAARHDSALDRPSSAARVSTSAFVQPVGSLPTLGPLELPTSPSFLPAESSQRTSRAAHAALSVVVEAGPPKLEASSPVRAAGPPRHSPPPPLPTLPSPADDVASFLVALHPSLVSLTPHLIAAGFDSVDALSSLVLLEPPILALTLDLIRVEAGRRAKEQRASGAHVDPVSIIQLKLLARRLGDEGKAMSASPVNERKLSCESANETSDAAVTTSAAHANRTRAFEARFASSSSSFATSAVRPAHPGSSQEGTSSFAPVASTSGASPSPPPRAPVTAAALVGSYLLELDPSGSLQYLVQHFVARGLATWRTLSELKDPAATRRLCADIIPAASHEVVDALLRFVKLVGR
ncbi:uncharacterized protein RHOBADRAFT_53115 [Rhodotorula graminis WP1]|uniref:Uncharacterized protein n=1 Tax=Rhodotorula graminis (strain WP1) TaxID=578459 RepID=A0A194S6B5_RHOGW|nr:uncharacterized protein RHOBADRAFT_53115 [Rhodotorula graminis WP1]KPV76132.1 hypothetical protein RHOBADRAFT_53115 [Rhodotorula graminis WP1]